MDVFDVADIADTLSRIESLHDAMADAIRGIADPDEAFRLATEFANRVRALHDEQETKLRKLRAEQAVRIKEQESLSLAKLADRISVSKARADQLVRDALTKGEA